LRLYDVVHTERKLTLVFEYLDQDLKKYLDVCEGGLESNILKSFLYQLLRGVAYCHHHRVGGGGARKLAAFMPTKSLMTLALVCGTRREACPQQQQQVARLFSS
ncbi:unnamed protein product, partial [Ectocarpus sp. 12 AP-2014]